MLDPPVTTLIARLAKRCGHFMPAALLESQLATLERPTLDEPALQVIGEGNADAAADEIVGRLGADGLIPA